MCPAQPPAMQEMHIGDIGTLGKQKHFQHQDTQDPPSVDNHVLTEMAGLAYELAYGLAYDHIF